MKTLYLYHDMDKPEAFESLKVPGTKIFCIGVKEMPSCSLEQLQRLHPTLVIERLPEAVNLNYLQLPLELHTLQPAFISLKG